MFGLELFLNHLAAVRKKAILYLRTLSYLRYEQILYRLWYKVRSKTVEKCYLSRIEQVPEKVESSKLTFKTDTLEYPWFNKVKIMRGCFHFLNDSADYGSKIDWQAKGKSRLWRYNLHYFQYLHPKGGLDTMPALSMMRDWIRHNPPGTADAWDPFPVSLRLVNWIKYCCQNDIAGDDYVHLSHSLYQHSLWLERSLEKHLLCNHLFKNSKALIFSGLFFSGPDAERWLSKGLRLLENELDGQILADGGHIERSPMYHCMILEDCLDLLNVCKDNPSKEVRRITGQLEESVEEMLLFLCGMTHPDGQIALFNDAALGIEVSPSDLIAYYNRLTGITFQDPNPPIWAFHESGYFVMTPRRGDRLLIDCGPIGPDYQPGHAHCDTLSFELSLDDIRVIVDSGCFTYEHGVERSYNRGNAGHNVLTINGENQSEVWDAHRCARRAYPLHPKIGRDSKGLFFEGGHDGYLRLPGRPLNFRRIRWNGNVLRIVDEVIGRGNYRYHSRLHLNPLCKYLMDEGKVWVEYGANKYLNIRAIGNGVLDIEHGWYSPEFGKWMPCPVITLSGEERSPFCSGWKIVTNRDDAQGKQGCRGKVYDEVVIKNDCRIPQ